MLAVSEFFETGSLEGHICKSSSVFLNAETLEEMDPWWELTLPKSESVSLIQILLPPFLLVHATDEALHQDLETPKMSPTKELDDPAVVTYRAQQTTKCFPKAFGSRRFVTYLAIRKTR